MACFFIIFLSVSIWKMKIKLKEINNNYISKENSACIKGIFIILVFFSHIRSYMSFNFYGDNIVIQIIKYVGQLMVTMFLFYSGYGIFENIKRNKEKYIKSFPKKRILKTFLEFALAIITFLICNLLANRQYNVKTILLAFTGWTSIGNSNWYMFVIFSLYIITFISFSIFKKNDKLSILTTFLLSILFIFIVSKYRPEYYINTAMCFVAGIIYSYFKEKIESKLKNNWVYYISIVILFLSFIFLYKMQNNIIIYNILAIIFSYIVVLFTMKIEIKNKILLWFGNKLFWIYILQRIPMMLFQHIIHNSIVFFAVCLLSTCLLAYTYSKLFVIFDKVKTRKAIEN